MGTNGYTILMEQDRCVVFRADNMETLRESVLGVSSPSDMAADCSQLLRELDYTGEPVLLAIPSSWCLAASFANDGLPTKSRDRALQYRFEEQLPLASEDMVMDFIDHKETSLGIGVQLTDLRPWVDALESEGIAVEYIAPSDFLVASQAIIASPSTPHLICINHDETLQLFSVHEGKVQGWQSMSYGSKRLVIWIRSIDSAINDQPIAELIGQGDASLDLPDRWEQQYCDQSYMELLNAAVIDVFAECETQVNLRCGSLSVTDPMRHVRGAVRGLVVAVILLAIALNATFIARGLKYRSLAQEHKAAVATTFQETLPEYSMVPVQPRRTMENELRRIQGLSGQQMVGSTDAAKGPGAIGILNDCLQRLPTKLRYRILDLAIDDGEVHIRGHARSHGEADQIASALRRDGRFEVEPPHTVKLKDKNKVPGGVEFTLRCLWVAEESRLPETAAVMMKGAE